MRNETLSEDTPRSLFVPMLLLAAGTLFSFAALGYAIGGQPGARQALEELARALEPLREMGALQLILFVFLNNAVKAGGVMLLGLGLGVIPFLFLVTNGLVLGIVIYQVVAERGVLFAVAGLLPHGTVELPALLIAMALGLELGSQVARRLSHRPSRVRYHLGRSVRIYLRWVVPALMVAALIEVLVTPLLLSLF